MQHLSGTEAPIDGRLRLAGALVLLVFGIFALRLFQLQVIESEALRERSERNSVRSVRLEAPRGEIVDRDGRVLATTRPAFAVQVVPNDLRDRERTFRVLGELIAHEPSALDERVGKPGGSRRYRPVRLDDDLDFERLARVESHQHALPGVSTAVQPLRHYLEGDTAAHLLGSIGEIRGDQLERERFEDYRAGDVIGQTGLESRFEGHLRGRSGGRNVVVDAAGREVELLDDLAPFPGGRVVLALDLDLQRAAEEAFLDVPEGEAPKMGAAVAMDVRTGDVLAMVSRPGYDPNAFAGGIDRELWKELTTDEWDPLQNRAIQNHYPPGSTHKAIVAAALLEEGVIHAGSRVYCPGFFRFGRRNYRCWKRSGHGSVDVVEALQKSCDVFFYTHGVTLGIDRMAKWAKAFGLGRRSGIDLSGEATGLVPSSTWKQKRLGEVWYPGETVSAAIGQGYNLYTPLQLAISYAALANGGTVLEPRLVLRLESRDQIVERVFEPKIAQQTEISPATLALVHRGLTAVVEEPGGTGGRARVEGVRVAGKTGTAQVVKLEQTEGLEDDEIPIRYRDHGWFGAFAPADEPEIAVGVFIEHGLHGSSAAGPVAQKILETYFAKQRGPEVLAQTDAGEADVAD